MIRYLLKTNLPMAKTKFRVFLHSLSCWRLYSGSLGFFFILLVNLLKESLWAYFDFRLGHLDRLFPENKYLKIGLRCKRIG